MNPFANALLWAFLSLTLLSSTAASETGPSNRISVSLALKSLQAKLPVTPLKKPLKRPVS
ncbi:MAG: hypothetical protein IE886_07390 [Campylobacterales bacterium]|nr:hypothetical protein [Campylobacterales bacterium]